MVEVRYIHKEAKNREIHEIVDLENTNQEYFTDRIVVGEEGFVAFILEQEDFEKIYEDKKRELEERYK